MLICYSSCRILIPTCVTVQISEIPQPGSDFGPGTINTNCLVPVMTSILDMALASVLPAGLLLRFLSVSPLTSFVGRDQV